MRLKYSLFLVCCLANTAVIADDIHKFGASIDYNLDQDSAPGYGAFYQWQFGESIEFEANYIQSNDIKVVTDEYYTAGDYSHLLIGANFIKQFNEQLSIKAGTGIGYVLTSSNQTLIEKQSIAPYIKLAANYQITEQLSVEAGQITHFQSNDIDTNFSLFFGLSFKFGDGKPTIVERPIATRVPVTSKPVYRTPTETIAAEAPSKPANTVSPIKQQVNNAWFVQLGAFSEKVNAQLTLVKMRHLAQEPTLSIIYANNYYRIVSMPFRNKQRADDHVDMIAKAYQITGYVTQLKFD